jgi:hypothetical protein
MGSARYTFRTLQIWGTPKFSHVVKPGSHKLGAEHVSFVSGRTASPSLSACRPGEDKGARGAQQDRTAKASLTPPRARRPPRSASPHPWRRLLGGGDQDQAVECSCLTVVGSLVADCDRLTLSRRAKRRWSNKAGVERWPSGRARASRRRRAAAPAHVVAGACDCRRPPCPCLGVECRAISLIILRLQ